MDTINTEYDALMSAVDADLEDGHAESALVRLEDFIRKYGRPDDDLIGLWGRETLNPTLSGIRRS